MGCKLILQSRFWKEEGVARNVVCTRSAQTKRSCVERDLVSNDLPVRGIYIRRKKRVESRLATNSLVTWQLCGCLRIASQSRDGCRGSDCFSDVFFRIFRVLVKSGVLAYDRPLPNGAVS